MFNATDLEGLNKIASNKYLKNEFLQGVPEKLSPN